MALVEHLKAYNVAAQLLGAKLYQDPGSVLFSGIDQANQRVMMAGWQETAAVEIMDVIVRDQQGHSKGRARIINGQYYIGPDVLLIEDPNSVFILGKDTPATIHHFTT